MKKYLKVVEEKKIAVAIYIVLFLYFVVQMNYYAENVEGFPDESRHLVYVAYLELTDAVVPDFIYMPSIITNAEDGSFVYEGINYLGHPPLYYNILNFFNDVTGDGVVDGTDMDNLRATSQVIAGIGLLLAFGYGLVKFDKNALHLLFGSIMISVPMLSYTSAGVNNDTLAFTGMILFFIALERLVEKREGWFTYLLFALSVAIVMLTKMTAAIILVLICVVVFLYIMIKEKSIRLLWNKYFLITIPIYLVVVAYYLHIYSIFGSFQPSLEKIYEDFFLQTSFYVEESARVYMSLGEYIFYYIHKFIQTWTSIASHNSLYKLGVFTNTEQIGLVLILFVPILAFFTRNKTPQIKLLLVSYIAVIITMGIQLNTCYSAFLSRGYLGGTQSRYYLCALIVFAFLICFVIQDRYRFLREKYVDKLQVIEWGLSGLCIGWAMLLCYEDFIYFLLNYRG